MATAVSIRFLAYTEDASRKVSMFYKQIKGVSDKIGQLGRGISGFGSGLTRAATLPIAAGIGLATREAINFETQVTNASRALSLGTKETKEFAASAKRIAPGLGTAPEKFAELAVTAGKLGIRKNEILQFAENTSQLGAATATDVTYLAEKLASIKAVSQASNKDLKLLGATINLLDDRVGGMTRTIIKFTADMAGVGKVTGFNMRQISAMGATFLKLGVNVSRAGKATNTMLLHLASATKQSPKAQKAFTQLGFSAEQVEKMMKANPEKGLITFLKTAQQFQGNKLAVLTDIFGKNHAPKIVALAEGYKELERAFSLARDEQTALNKLQAETEKKLGSSAGRIAVFQARMSSLGITIGTALLPGLNKLLKAITPLINKFAKFAEANPKIVMVGIAILGVVAAIGPLLVGVGSVITAMSTLAPIIASVGAVIGGVAGAIAAFVASPVALFLAAAAAIGAAAYTIWRNWEPIKSFFVNLGVTISNSLSAAWNAMFPKMISGAKELGITLVTYLSNPIAGIVRATFNLSKVWLQIGSQVFPGITAQARAFFKYWWEFWTDSFPNAAVRGVYDLGVKVWSVSQNFWLRTFPNGMNSWLGVTLNVFSNFWGSVIPNYFTDVARWFGEAGQHLMLTFANGIRSRVNEALRPIVEFINRVRSYLPSSDAKRGALSDLTASGRALFTTVASGVDGNPLEQKVAMAAQRTRDSLSFNPFTTPAAATNSSNIVLNFNPTINIEGGGDSGGTPELGNTLVDALRPYARELIEMLTRSNERINRGVF